MRRPAASCGSFKEAKSMSSPLSILCLSSSRSDGLEAMRNRPSVSIAGRAGPQCQSRAEERRRGKRKGSKGETF